jgi:hypothetical protein
VWRVVAGQRTAYVKVSADAGDYTSEVNGCGYAAHALAAHQAPRLLAVNADLRAILTSSLPGRIGSCQVK